MARRCVQMYRVSLLRGIRLLDRMRATRRWDPVAPAKGDPPRRGQRSLPRSAHSLTPEQRLAYAVIEDALRVVTSGGRPCRSIVADARQWLLSDERGWPFSFCNLCDALDVSAEKLRRHLARWLTDEGGRCAGAPAGWANHRAARPAGARRVAVGGGSRPTPTGSEGGGHGDRADR